MEKKRSPYDTIILVAFYNVFSRNQLGLALHIEAAPAMSHNQTSVATLCELHHMCELQAEFVIRVKLTYPELWESFPELH